MNQNQKKRDELIQRASERLKLEDYQTAEIREQLKLNAEIEKRKRFATGLFLTTCALGALLLAVVLSLHFFPATVRMEANDQFRDSMFALGQAQEDDHLTLIDCQYNLSKLKQEATWCKVGYQLEDMKVQGNYTAVICRKV